MVKSVQERNRESQERQPTTREGYSPSSKKIKKTLDKFKSMCYNEDTKKDNKRR
jgi:hypothetical protein